MPYHEQVKDLLSDTHVLIVDDEDNNRELLTTMFKTVGAIVWPCDSQLCGIARYFKLYKERKLPRVVIADWWLSDPDSAEFQTLKETNSLERHGTCSMLFENIRELDRSAFMAVYTNDVDSAKTGLERMGLGHVEVFSKLTMDAAAFAKRIACHKGIIRQRVMASSIIQMAMEDVQKDTNTKLKALKDDLRLS